MTARDEPPGKLHVAALDPGTEGEQPLDEIDRLRLELSRWSALNDRRNESNGKACTACGLIITPETEVWGTSTGDRHMNTFGNLCGPLRVGRFQWPPGRPTEGETP